MSGANWGSEGAISGGAAAAALHLIAITRTFGGARKDVGFKPARDEYQIAGDAKGPTTA